MKLCLGMMITAGEAPYLRLHLPLIAQAIGSAVIVIDPRENLEAERRALDDAPFSLLTTIHREFDNDWSAQFNAVIKHAEQCGYDAILRLDPDEALFAHDIDTIRTLLVTYPVLYLARVNYWMDRQHYAPEMYPDYQGRSWLLNRGIRYGGKHHEGLVLPHDTEFVCATNPTIHHYGDVGIYRILMRDLHYLNVAREQAGHPPLTERPADREFPTRHNVVYNGSQPLDPNIVGLYAPWSE